MVCLINQGGYRGRTVCVVRWTGFLGKFALDLDPELLGLSLEPQHLSLARSIRERAGRRYSHHSAQPAEAFPLITVLL